MRSQSTQPGQAALTYKEQLIEFTKTRKDSSNLKSWKEDSQFTTFYEDLKLEAADALCLQIIDPTFNPSVINDPADQKLFDKQCTYMAKVLRAKITATKARRFIDTAKKVDRPDLYWKLIYKAYTESDLATTYGGHVLAAMQELQVSQFQQRGDAMTKFQHLLKQYNDFMPENMQDTMIIALLKAATSDDDELATHYAYVKGINQAARSVRGTSALTIAEIIDMYQEAATELDTRTLNNPRSTRSKSNFRNTRNVLASSISGAPRLADPNFNRFIDWDVKAVYMEVSSASLFTANTSITQNAEDDSDEDDGVFEVNAAGRNRRGRPFNPDTDIPSEAFRQLKPATKQAWVNEPDTVRKAVISSI